ADDAVVAGGRCRWPGDSEEEQRTQKRSKPASTRDRFPVCHSDHSKSASSRNHNGTARPVGQRPWFSVGRPPGRSRPPGRLGAVSGLSAPGPAHNPKGTDASPAISPTPPTAPTTHPPPRRPP